MTDMEIRQAWKAYALLAIHNCHEWDADENVTGKSRTNGKEIQLYAQWAEIPLECEQEAVEQFRSPIEYFEEWKGRQLQPTTVTSEPAQSGHGVSASPPGLTAKIVSKGGQESSEDFASGWERWVPTTQSPQEQLEDDSK